MFILPRPEIKAALNHQPLQLLSKEESPERSLTTLKTVFKYHTAKSKPHPGQWLSHYNVHKDGYDEDAGCGVEWAGLGQSSCCITQAAPFPPPTPHPRFVGPTEAREAGVLCTVPGEGIPREVPSMADWSQMTVLPGPLRVSLGYGPLMTGQGSIGINTFNLPCVKAPITWGLAKTQRSWAWYKDLWWCHVLV